MSNSSRDSDIVYSRISFEVLQGLEEFHTLIRSHYKEISAYQDIELKPDWDKYLQMEREQKLTCFVARKGGDKVIGYAIFFVQFNMHYRESLQAVQDIIYIDKEERGFGSDFIQWMDKELKSDGVQVVYHHVKCKHDWGKALESLGYNHIEKMYGKRLDTWQ